MVHIRPVVTLDKHAREVAAPVAAHPPETLAQVLGPILQRRLHFRLLVVLHGDFPIVAVHPSRDEVIVVSVELARAPLFVREAVGERIVLENGASISDGPTGETWQAAINVEASGAVEISALEVCRTQEAPDAHVLRAPQPLRSAHAAHLWILKGCQHPLQHLWRPHNIIVHEDGNAC